MNMVDTHTHLFLEEYKGDCNETIERAFANGVNRLLLPNIDSGTVENILHLQKQFPAQCLPMMGLHPTSVKEDFEKELTLIEKELNRQKYYGVGEIGIDLYWDKQFEEQQREAFRLQLQWAKNHHLPVSIHTRNAFKIVLEVVKQELTDDLTGVFHCFTGTVNEAHQIMDIGFKMGIGGIITFKNSGLAGIVKEIPIKHLVLETDAPYLTPVPFRGKRNESSYLIYIAENIAEAKEISVEEVAEITTANASVLFKLSL